MYKNIKPLFFFKSLQIVKYIEKKYKYCIMD